MAVEPHSGVVVLEVHTCWALMRIAEVGRLAVCTADGPDILPVNYLVDHGTVVFRTGEGTKLAAAIACAQVAFEVDGYDPGAKEAWSVVIKGQAHEITTMSDVLDAMTFPLFPWHAGPKHRFVRVVPSAVSGRRFHVLDSAAWRTPMTGAPSHPLRE